MDLVAIPFILVLAYFTFTWLCSVIEGLLFGSHFNLLEPEKLIMEIKPLEWIEDLPSRVFHAYGVDRHRYVIFRLDGGEYLLDFNDREIGSYRTLEEAKSMAQKDHERRSK